MAHGKVFSINPGKYKISTRAKTLYSVFIFVGLLTFVMGLIQNPERLWTSYLTSFFFVFGVSMAALFFVALQFVTNAGWSVNIRRFMEGMTCFIPWAFAGAVVFFFGAEYIYPWLDQSVLDGSALIRSKTKYLNFPFFIIRTVAFFVGWMLFKKVIVGHSVKQDEDGSLEHSRKNGLVSIGFILFFALSYSLFSVDFVMSIQPKWYSTIYGVYCFIGSLQAALAFMIITLIWTMRKGLFNGLVTVEHLHDLAKYLKGFTVFWAYIAFSQFMLIWYANIPEETEFYLERAHNGWMAVSMFLLIFKFIVPFVALLPRGAKRNQNHLLAVSALVIVTQYVDIYWQIYPNFNDNVPMFSGWELGMLLGFVGLFLMSFHKFLAKNNLVPVKDPRIQESCNHHVTY